ncbi:MAG: polysaccharide deacetylase family protein [Oscillospiraceae bacterium]|nr:polysaccharide deacetylase family protein [Oscillospiraceae bacterium]
MNITKRIIACLLGLCILVSAAGCGPLERRGNSGAESSSPDSVPAVDLDPPEVPEVSDSSEQAASPTAPDSSAPPEDESAAEVMGREFASVANLSTALVEWGSGGPTDQDGRPEGALAYQEKYGKYDAYFYIPGSDLLWLTFDEGYENGFTPAILDTLKEKRVKAIFFVTMHFATGQPELVRRMIDEGHIVGNHSTAHKPYPSLPVAEAAEDLKELHDYVKETYGYEMEYFRFPEGKFSEQSLAMVQEQGYKSLFWSFAYVDYYADNQPLTLDAMDKVTGKSHPGALYLLHAISATNSEILTEAIDVLRGQGYEFADWSSPPPKADTAS